MSRASLDDDVWHNTEPIVHDQSNSLIVDYDRRMAHLEWRRMQLEFERTGYKDGIVEGKDVTIQKGFNVGYVEGVRMGLQLGKFSGELSAIMSFITTHQDLFNGDCRMEKQELFEEIKNLVTELEGAKAGLFIKDYVSMMCSTSSTLSGQVMDGVANGAAQNGVRKKECCKTSVSEVVNGEKDMLQDTSLIPMENLVLEQELKGLQCCDGKRSCSNGQQSNGAVEFEHGKEGDDTSLLLELTKIQKPEVVLTDYRRKVEEVKKRLNLYFNIAL